MNAAVPPLSQRLVKAAAVGMPISIDTDKYQNISTKTLRQRLGRHHFQPHTYRAPLFQRAIGKAQWFNVRTPQSQQQGNPAASRTVKHHTFITAQGQFQLIHRLFQPRTLPLKPIKNFSNHTVHFPSLHRLHIFAATFWGDRPK